MTGETKRCVEEIFVSCSLVYFGICMCLDLYVGECMLSVVHALYE